MSSLKPSNLGPSRARAARTRRFAAAMVACCMALLGLTPAANAQGSDWFEGGSDEPTYWSGKGPPTDSPYAVEEQSPDDSYEGDPPPGDARDEQERSQRAVQEFSPHLTPYGVWVDDGVYGRVWVPHARVVGPGFAPYVTSGHWELTVNDDWLWVSDYPFGWVTFHYGHWVWLSSARWAWVPGYRWAPAWVDFRVASPGVAYVGWGPSPPRYIWRHGVFVSFGTVVSVPYVFCPTASVFSVSVHRHIVRDRHHVHRLSRETRPYRTRRIYGGASVRAPSWREARIPERAVPRRRVIGRPQSVSQRATFDRRAQSSRQSNVGERRFYGDSRRGNTATRRSAPSYVRPEGFQRREGFERRDGFDRREYRAPSYTRPQQQRQRPPAGAAPRRDAPAYQQRSINPPAQRGYAPVQGNRRSPPASAPRVPHQYRDGREQGGQRAPSEGRPPPSAFEQRESRTPQRSDGRAQPPSYNRAPSYNRGRAGAAPARRAQPRTESRGSGARARPTYRSRGEPSRR